MIPTLEQIKEHIVLQHPSDYKIGQGFGKNYVDFYAKMGMDGHNGIDYSQPHSKPVYSPCEIEIVDFYYENKDRGYGTTLWARSKSFQVNDLTYKLEFVFAHLDKFDVTRGKTFKMGEVIAYSDNTGKYTTGAHLHFGARLVRKTLFGWKLADPNNGYKGYLDPEPLTDFKNSLKQYEGKAIYIRGLQSGKMHYYVSHGILYHVSDEVAMACGSMLFSEAMPVDGNIIRQAEVRDYQIDYGLHKTKEVKQLLKLLVDNPKRAKELFNKHF